MKVGFLFFILLVLFGLIGCLRVTMWEMTWHIVLHDKNDAAPIESCSVVLVIRGYDGKEERFGPAVTDKNGECVIAVPEHSRPLESYVSRKPSFWLEVRTKDGRADIAEATSIHGDGVIFRIKTENKPNQALLPTSMSVTDRAYARSAPDTLAADL